VAARHGVGHRGDGRRVVAGGRRGRGAADGRGTLNVAGGDTGGGGGGGGGRQLGFQGARHRLGQVLDEPAAHHRVQPGQRQQETARFASALAESFLQQRKAKPFLLFCTFRVLAALGETSIEFEIRNTNSPKNRF